MRHYADRTLVLAGESINEMTGEVTGRMVPKHDKFLACGRRQRLVGADVGLRLENGHAGLSGLQTCGSGWVCPVCSGKIQQGRADDLGKVLAWARAEGHTLAMVTLTVSHKRRDSLDSVWDAVSAGWAAVTGGQGAKNWGSESVEDFREREDRWDAARQLAIEGKGRYPRGGRDNVRPVRRIGDREARGVVGWARAVEVTHGLNGWHVHVHAVLVLSGDPATGESNANLLGESMFRRWQHGIGKTGFTASRRRGVDVQVRAAAAQKLADYLAKDGFGDTKLEGAAKITASVTKAGRTLALEAALGDAKWGKRQGKTPFQVLRDIDPDAPGVELAVWREWVEGSAGRLALTWSRGFRELVPDLDDEKTDEELAAAELSGDDVLMFPHACWYLIRDRRAELLELAETAGVAAVIDWCRDWGGVAVLPEPKRTS